MTDRLFFVHIMKTAGTSLVFQLLANYPRHEVYPDPAQDPDDVVAYTEPSYLLNLPPERTRAIRAYSGHFPFAVVDRMPGPFVTLTVLRDPVDRTISYLQQCRKLVGKFRETPLEQIYEDPWQYQLAMENYQARIFASTAADEPLHVMHRIDIDARRMAIAKANLERVDEIGVLDRYDEFAARVNARFGWPEVAWERRRVGETGTVSAALRRRIAEDNAPDMEFYEYARELVRRRSGV